MKAEQAAEGIIDIIKGMPINEAGKALLAVFALVLTRIPDTEERNAIVREVYQKLPVLVSLGLEDLRTMERSARNEKAKV